MPEHKRFQFILADTEELKNAIYRLRYQIYVEEFRFEKPKDHPYGYERDEYDPYSLHFAAVNEKKEIIGTIRLILHSHKGFPITHVAKSHLLEQEPALDKVAEISRLAILKNYRRRLGDGHYGVESYTKKTITEISENVCTVSVKNERRGHPLIIIGLYHIMYQTSKKMGLTHWYMISETRLFEALKRYGFVFRPIGNEIEYHGIRVPCLGIINEIEQNLLEYNPDFLRFLLTGVEKLH